MDIAADVGFTDRLARSLGLLEKGLAHLGLYSQSISNPYCPGPVDGECVSPCWGGWCIPPIRMPQIDADRVADAVRVVWPEIVQEADKLDISASTVADLNARIRRAAGLPDDWQFLDRPPPLSTDRDGDDSWQSFVSVMHESAAEYPEQAVDEVGCYLIACLAWNTHVPALGLTTGWLLACALRIAQGVDVYAPDPAHLDTLLDALDGTRPGLTDAETLRAIWPHRFGRETAV